ncbi:MAG: HD domain-containing protein [Defluviitaleaceae bacterium]|nr:HD domain-containing protein [Defluviitaleaceae bacterium]
MSLIDVYEIYRNDSDINTIINNINEMLHKYAMEKDVFLACHGRAHAMFVVDRAEYILKSLGYDDKTVKLGKIAALLHDIGNIAGRWNHARKSAALAAVFLDGHFSVEEKNMIVQAIDDHSNGENISSVVGAALLIADKLDVSKKRILNWENLDGFTKKMLEIDDVSIEITGKAMTINYVTNKNFCKASFIDDYKKGFSIPRKAAKYLCCECVFQFNGEEVIL